MSKKNLVEIVILHNNGNTFANIFANKGSDLEKVANIAKILKEDYGWSKKKIGSILKPSLSSSVVSGKSFADLLHGITPTEAVAIVKKYVNANARHIIAAISVYE